VETTSVQPTRKQSVTISANTVATPAKNSNTSETSSNSISKANSKKSAEVQKSSQQAAPTPDLLNLLDDPTPARPATTSITSAIGVPASTSNDFDPFVSAPAVHPNSGASNDFTAFQSAPATSQVS
jgi:hypothetical protein